MILETFKIASILMPAFELPTFTEEHNLLVVANASGIDSINAKSPFVQPFSTNAE